MTCVAFEYICKNDELWRDGVETKSTYCILKEDIVPFLAPISGASQTPVVPVPGDLCPPAFISTTYVVNINSRRHIHICINKKYLGFFKLLAEHGIKCLSIHYLFGVVRG